MKFMVIVKASKESEAGELPSNEMLAEMGKYNETLAKAGILLDGQGLKSSKFGARVKFAGKGRSVVDGPFPETKELIAGYWLLQCKSLEECIEWVKKCPNPMNGDSEIEIRPLHELADFEMSAETKGLHERVAAAVEQKGGVAYGSSKS